MLEIIQFHCLLEEKNKKVTLECLPLADQYFGYDKTNYYYALYYKLASKDFVRLGTMDLFSLCDIYSITSTDSTRTLVFHNKSKLVFSYYNRTDSAIYLKCSFTDPSGNSYNQISNRLSNNTEIPLDKSKVHFLILSGPSDTIPNKNLPQPVTRYPYAGGGIFYTLNSDLSNFPSTSGYNRITVTQKNSTNIDWGNYIVGNLLHDQYHDPKFYGDISTTGGGDGDYDDNGSDTIGLPDLTALNENSISNTKFFSCYKMTPNQLSVLSEHLWTDWRNIAEAIGNSILKPLDFVISLNMLPVNVESTTKVIKMGWFDLNHAVQGGLINYQYVRVNCGSLTIKKKWGGAIDYQTDVSLFLPFIGEVTLNANEVMGATLTVIYTVDVMSGNCIASVQVVKDELNAILYQYNGNVASNFSITSLDYSNVMAGALQLAVAVGTGAGGAGGFMSAVSSASNLLSGADVRRAGNLSATSGFMGIKNPYLILSRPIQSLPSEYNTFRGFVSNITLALSECSGYTKVAEIHLENIPATSAELDELDGLLKAGVIF